MKNRKSQTVKELLDNLKLLINPLKAQEIKQDFEFVATKLDISVDELQSYMDAPKKTYKDYKSQKNI